MKRVASYIAASIAAFLLAGVPPALGQGEAGPEGGVSAYASPGSRCWTAPCGYARRAGGLGGVLEQQSDSPAQSRERPGRVGGGAAVPWWAIRPADLRDRPRGPRPSGGQSVFRLRAGEIRFDLPPDDFAPVSVRVPGGAVARFPVPGRHG